MPTDGNTGTEYVVLKRVALTDRADAHAWMESSRGTARDAQTAIKAAHGNGNTETYVAIPARSFAPIKVTPKVETTLILEDAK